MRFRIVAMGVAAVLALSLAAVGGYLLSGFGGTTGPQPSHVVPAPTTAPTHTSAPPARTADPRWVNMVATATSYEDNTIADQFTGLRLATPTPQPTATHLSRPTPQPVATAGPGPTPRPTATFRPPTPTRTPTGTSTFIWSPRWLVFGESPKVCSRRLTVEGHTVNEATISLGTRYDTFTIHDEGLTWEGALPELGIAHVGGKWEIFYNHAVWFASVKRIRVTQTEFSVETMIPSPIANGTRNYVFSVWGKREPGRRDEILASARIDRC